MNLFSKRKKKMELKDVTTLLTELRLPTSLIFTPTNLEAEKKKFFDSDTYNPQFKYRIVKNRNAEIFKELSDVDEILDVDPRISGFYIDLIASKKEINDLIYAVGNNSVFSDISVRRFGKPNIKLFRNASIVLRGSLKSYPLLVKESTNKGEVLEYEDIEKIFQIVFQEFGLDGWGVSKSMNIAKNQVKVGIKTKQVLVDRNIQRSKFKLKKTLVHEVGTHVLRAYNGLNSGFEALSKPNLVEYLDVEEGLATWNEYQMGLLTSKWLKEKAAYVYASYIGESLTFRELFNILLGVLPKYSAFTTVYRVKRGLSDTSEPGIYTKDICYFKGFRKVMKKLSEESNLYNLLYAGKIGFKQCEWVEDGLIPKAKIIPSNSMWMEIFKKAGI
ncbi:MAG: tyrosine/phenylalanine carboxypeptidase domain-containing protein [Candidatus Dojkabacteria bacterium]